MDIWELIQATKDKSDKELAKMTSQLPVTLTPEEVKMIRPIFDKASLQWILFGPPDDVRKKLQGILGKTRTKRLFTYFGL